MAHCTNLGVVHLSKFLVVCQIESLLSSFYKYFSHSSKRHAEFVKLVALMHTKGNKIQWNIKTGWILQDLDYKDGRGCIQAQGCSIYLGVNV